MATPVRIVVVGVASVEELDPVLPCAIRLAASVSARLHVVHVVDLPEYPFLEDAAAFVGRTAEELTRELARGIEERLREQVARFEPAPTELEVHALRGSAHARLTGFAAERGADLLVVGATRRGRIWRRMLGTTTERVLRSTSVPVLVVHRPFFRPVGRVLLATDLSAASAAVYERAADLVEGLFGPGAVEARALFVLAESLLPPTVSDELLEERARGGLREFVAGRAPRAWPLTAAMRQGDPAAEIDREAEEWDADLLVLGTHGRRGVPRLVFGSVAAAALRDCPRNALVIPASARAAGASPADEDGEEGSEAEGGRRVLTGTAA